MGKNVNIPWEGGTSGGGGPGDQDYIHAFHEVVMPIAYEFDPDLVIGTRGFSSPLQLSTALFSDLFDSQSLLGLMQL